MHSFWLRLAYTALDGRDLAKGVVRSRTPNDLNYHLCRFFQGDLREWLASRIASRLPKGEPASESDPRVRSLEQSGFVMLPDLVTKDEATELCRAIESISCHDPYRSHLGTFSCDSIPRQTRVAHVETEGLLRVPGLFRIANDPGVLAVVERQLGAKPTAMFNAWWSSPAEGPAEQAELFHRDKDDWRFLKLFVYLTDVDDTTGPHVYVPTSHRYDGLEFRRQRRYSEDEVTSVFGKVGLHHFRGPAGTSFLENTYGLHRGLPPKRGRRLIFQVVYSLLPVLGAPDKPHLTMADVHGSFDPWINRLHIAQ